MRNPFRRREKIETRAVTSLPFDRGGLLHQSTVTQDTALGLAPVFAAVRILAGTVSTLPLQGFRRLGDERQRMGGLPQLFQQLSDAGQLVSWLHQCMTSLTLRGNAYGLVTRRDGFGFPVGVEWLNPSDMHVDDSRSRLRPVWYWQGRVLPGDDLLHIPWFVVPGRVEGLSPIGAFAATLNTGLYAQAYGNDWFEGGGFPPGTMKNVTQPTIDQPVADEIRGRLVAAIRDRRPIVHGSDWDYKPITVAPNEAQFVETMRLSATQIANIYGLPPEKVGGVTGQPLTYATTELNQIEVQLAIRPWLVVLEHAFAANLPERQYVKFNADAIVRADLKTRWETHKIAVEMGARNLDEVRAFEDEAPLPNGQGAEYVPLHKTKAQPQLVSADGDESPLRVVR